MNQTVFKSGTIWINIGEIVTITGDFAASLLDSTLFSEAITRQSVHPSPADYVSFQT